MLIGLAVVMIAAAACSGGDNDTALVGTTSSNPAASSTTAAPTPSTVAPTTSSSGPSYLEVLAYLAAVNAADDAAQGTPEAEGSTDPVTGAARARRPAPAVPEQSRVNGGTLKPVRGGGAPINLYQGVMGKLGPDDQVIAPIVPAPPTLAPEIAPLTGLPYDDAAAPGRPAIVVKIDNDNKLARPQAGLNQADVIYEERIEGSVTRLAAVFHSHHASPVGPIRSARSTDYGIIGSLNNPMISFSGGNAVIVELLHRQPVQDRSAEVFTGYFRSRRKRAPHNLYSDTVALWKSGTGTAPNPLFEFRVPGEGLGPFAQNAKSVSVSFGKQFGTAPARFQYDAGRDRWLRFQGGTAHVDDRGVQVAPANVIIQFVSYIGSGLSDRARAQSPEAVLTGTGGAWIFSGGQVIPGNWTKSSMRSVTTFTDLNGNPIKLLPGQTFVELAEGGLANWD